MKTVGQKTAMLRFCSKHIICTFTERPPGSFLKDITHLAFLTELSFTDMIEKIYGYFLS